MAWEFFTKDGTVKKSGGSGGSPVVFKGQRTAPVALVNAYNPILGFDTLYDSDGYYNGSRFQPKKAGYYRISATITVSGLGTGGPELYIRKNTIATIPVYADCIAGAMEGGRADGWSTLTAETIIYMNGSTDFVEVNCWMPNASCTLQGGAAVKCSFEGESVSVQGADGPAGGPTLVPMDIWHTVGNTGEPAFLNAWVNYGGAGNPIAKFRKYPDGRVRLSGLVKGGGNGTTIFTLPVGYRPASEQAYVVWAGGGYAVITIQVAGNVIPSSVAGAGNVVTDVFLDGIEFDTESVFSYPSTPASSVPRVVALPTSPIDGQEVYYVVDAANGVLWHLKYNIASASAYKWEFVGGGPLKREGVGARNWGAVESITTLAFGSLTTPVALTLPLAGDYLAEGDAICTSGVAGLACCLLLWATGDGAPNWTVADALFVTPAGMGGSIHGSRTFTGKAAGSTIEHRYAVSGAGSTGSFYNRNLYVTPVRVG